MELFTLRILFVLICQLTLHWSLTLHPPALLSLQSLHLFPSPIPNQLPLLISILSIYLVNVPMQVVSQNRNSMYMSHCSRALPTSSTMLSMIYNHSTPLIELLNVLRNSYMNYFKNTFPPLINFLHLLMSLDHTYMEH